MNLPQIKYLQHYSLWLFMYLFVFDYHFLESNWVEAIRNTCLEVALYMVVFYVNYLFAIPNFLQKKKQWSYVLFLLLFLSVYIFLIKYSGWETYFYEGNFWRNLMSMTINFTLFWLISTLYWYYKKQQEEREAQLQWRADKLETEMKFLKAQLSPHFIFNTLNNIYSLVQQGHKNAAPMLAKLSEILRYLLYDSTHEKILLEKEISTIKKYIELQLLRKPKSQNIDFYQEGKVSQLKIIPLLLLNFVENCFKHGNTDLSEEGWIKISCIVTDDHQLHFTAENSKTPGRLSGEETGLGNKNIRRQLELHYPGKHELTIENGKEVHTTRLILNTL